MCKYDKYSQFIHSTVMFLMSVKIRLKHYTQNNL